MDSTTQELIQYGEQLYRQTGAILLSVDMETTLGVLLKLMDNNKSIVTMFFCKPFEQKIFDPIRHYCSIFKVNSLNNEIIFKLKSKITKRETSLFCNYLAMIQHYNFLQGGDCYIRLHNIDYSQTRKILFVKKEN